MTWARKRRRVLARMRMILGDPARAELYGFAAWRDGTGLICLRNPASTAQPLRAAWRELLQDARLPADVTLSVTSVYGPVPTATVQAGDAFSLSLPPYGLALCELKRV